MFIGGASASTAGGIKVGTFAVILVAVFATVRKRRHARVFARELPADVVRQALIVGGVAVFTLFGMVFLIAAVEDFALDQIIFETVSALATCGLSTGLTAQMGDWGRGVLVAAMFIGRFGPLTLALLMQGGDEGEPYRFAEERVRIA
jgi:Trk-type K+ transport system membrane component